MAQTSDLILDIPDNKSLITSMKKPNKQVIATGVGTDTDISTSGIVTQLGSLVMVLLSGIVTGIQVWININVLESPTGNFIITSTGGSSYEDSDVDTHLNVGLANTGDVLTWGGTDYEWSTPSTIGAGNPVVNGSITGVGNTTLRLVLQDSGLIDIDLSTLNTSASDEDINTRITKAVSLCKN